MTKYLLVLLFSILLTACSDDIAVFKNKLQFESKDNITFKQGAYYIHAEDGRTLKVTAYGESMLRLQTIKKDDSFFADDYYEMVLSHDWSKKLEVNINLNLISFSTNKVKLDVDKNTLAATFFMSEKALPVLAEKSGVYWQENTINTYFEYDAEEHFTGLGHGYFARSESIDLKGKRIKRNYGAQPIEQAPLIVPFYMSSKGYGVFLNSMFENEFTFGADDKYQFSINDHGFNGQMDYFFIAGPKLTTVLDNYTQLTGRPRLPMKSMFGLQLSDKGHDHNSSTPSNMGWWQDKITEHRQAGYPLDHVINDNRWRAAGGQRCLSKVEWDKERYPDPKAYAKWLDKNGLVTTLDFNRCIAKFSEGWLPSFNLPEIDNIEFKDSAPDLTHVPFQEWFWQIFYDKSLNPALEFPGDALWIDEFDEQGAASKKMILSNGRSSGEMRNYWFFLIAKSLVQQGWDKANLNKRPFVWVRGMTAGAQRYATLWSGDIYPNYSDMKGQIRSMQLAGMAGFPYWGHDAGGFYDWKNNVGPDENMYAQWAMAMGSFAPIWKPHGMGESRWPLDRNEASQHVAKKYSELRYQLMPYIYSAAHQAAESGIPMTRAMLLEHQDNPLAWQYDLQYMWGNSILVAPNTQDNGALTIWLPKGNWYRYDSNTVVKGDSEITINASTGELPLYVKAGSIIPKRDYVLSTAFINKEKLKVDIYTGENAKYQLVEDDDKTEAFRDNNEKLLTNIRWDESSQLLTIDAAEGEYKKMPMNREYGIKLFGLKAIEKVRVNNKLVKFTQINGEITFTVPSMGIYQSVKVELL